MERCQRLHIHGRSRDERIRVWRVRHHHVKCWRNLHLGANRRSWRTNGSCQREYRRMSEHSPAERFPVGRGTSGEFPRKLHQRSWVAHGRLMPYDPYRFAPAIHRPNPLCLAMSVNTHGCSMPLVEFIKLLTVKEMSKHYIYYTSHLYTLQKTYVFKYSNHLKTIVFNYRSHLGLMDRTFF